MKNAKSLSGLVSTGAGDERQTTGDLKRDLAETLALAVIGDSTNPGELTSVARDGTRGGRLRTLRYLDVQDQKDIEPVFRAAVKGRADALVVLGNRILNFQRKQVVDLATKHRLPASYARPEYIEAGGLMTYGTNYSELFRRAATYVDKILKGAQPGDIPVEQPKKFEFIVDLKAAKQESAYRSRRACWRGQVRVIR